MSFIKIINISPEIITGNCSLKCKCYIDTENLIEWNGNKYTVYSSQITKPALRAYASKPVDAELTVNCISSSSNANNLTIVIPILSNSSGIIINNNQSVDIPLKPFYYYSNKKNDFIVFGKENAILASNIQTSTVDASKFEFIQTQLFYNPAGILSSSNDTNEIYIDCGTVGPEKTVTTDTKKEIQNGNQNLNNFIQISWIIPFILILILAIVAYVMIKK